MLGAYPIGSIYLSVNNTSPASLFGGTWEKIQDRFLLASGSSYSLGATGGSAEVVLTKGQMPQHRHESKYGYAFDQGYVDDVSDWKLLYPGSLTAGTGNNGFSLSGSRITSATGHRFISLNYDGNNEAHENMPPYLVVNVWKRIS